MRSVSSWLRATQWDSSSDRSASRSKPPQIWTRREPVCLCSCSRSLRTSVLVLVLVPPSLSPTCSCAKNRCCS
uniref:Uncharacterized protein n=1 Tax=Fagus sylvatica TaxID=28930 RepID=A0A2N9IHN3_FAGSY